mgnify:CR=1 FL=1
MHTLADQLLVQKEGFLKNAAPEDVNIMSQAMARLKASDVLDRALKQGDAAPLFDLPDATGQQISLQERLISGPAILTFYRGVW